MASKTEKRGILADMWRDLKIWLIVRYASSRIYGPRTTDEMENLFLADYDERRLYIRRRAVIVETHELGKGLYLAIFPTSWRSWWIRWRIGKEWEDAPNHFEGPISSLFSTALEEGFLVYKNAGTPQENRDFIRVSHTGDNFITIGGGSLWFAKKYWIISGVMYVLMAWAIAKVSGLSAILLSHLP